MNKSVNLTKRVELADGRSGFYPAVVAKNGRVKPDYVIVNGAEEHHPEGCYYLDWTEGEKRIRRSVGKDAAAAGAYRKRQEAVLAGKPHGIKAVELELPSGDGMLIVNVAAAYLQDLKHTKKPKTHSAYATALDYFQKSCHKQRLDEIEKRDLLQFVTYLRAQGLSDRTVYNKFEQLMTFLKAQKLTSRLGVTKYDWPRFTEEEPEIYEKEELDALFAACTAEERVWYSFFLMTGEREQEVMYTYWSDINLAAGTVRVSHKPERGWTPKVYKERSIPVPSKLVEILKTWKGQKERGCPLLFPTSGCNPKLDFLDCLKAAAERAGLNPANFILHKFRATFATWALWSGVDLRTVQHWMGHSDMESTMRYLKPNRSTAVREKVEAIWGNNILA